MKIRSFIALSVLLLESVASYAQYTWDDILYCMFGGENINAIIPAPDQNKRFSKPGWNLIFRDEFDEDSLSSLHWNKSALHDDGQDSCERYFSMNPANVTLNEEEFAEVWNTETSLYPGCPFSRGEMKSFSVQDTVFKSYYFYQDSYLEARVKLFCEHGQGAAMWLWGVGKEGDPGGSYGPWSEIDVFELPGDSANTFNAAYHWGYDTINAQRIHRIRLYTDSAQVYNLSDQWTTFAVEWHDDHITWYVNEVAVKTLDLTVVPPYCTEVPRYAQPRFPLSLRFSTGMNTVGNLTDTASSEEMPRSMKIEYVRVYAQAGKKACPIEDAPGSKGGGICATEDSPEHSQTMLKTRYYPDASYTWASEAFGIEPQEPVLARPPERVKIWIREGIEAGQSYPISLHVSFPWGYSEDDTVMIWVSPGPPSLPGSGFLAARIDTTCFFEIRLPAEEHLTGCEYKLDTTEWAPGVFRTISGTRYSCFGRFRPNEEVGFSFREMNTCGYSPVQTGSLAMPPPPAGCNEGIGDPGSVQDARFRVFPNPVNDLLTVTLQDHRQIKQQNMRLKILDLCGRVMDEQLLLNQVSTITVNHLSGGLYFVVIYSNGIPVYSAKIQKL